MTEERFARAREIFLAVHELGPVERKHHLDEACGEDAEIRREVEELLGFRDADEISTLSLSPAISEAPETIGPYRLLQKLGEGGMGVVYEAEQREPIRRRVALKLIKWGLATKEVLARFEAERQALALMSHPSIARVYEAGATEKGLPYFVMEYVPGVPLSEYCDTQRLTTRERLELFVQVCQGVQHAHQKGIIHRDLKPSNVLVSLQDGRAVPKIIDFGIAKATTQRLTERTVFTELGQWIGTPQYMSPEQAEMTGLDVDTRTDVYSLGVMLYELLVGVPPLDPETLRRSGFDEMRRRIREEEPSRPSTRVSGIGADSDLAAQRRRTDSSGLVLQLRGDLDWITMKALEKDRGRRYASAAALAEDVERHLHDEPVRASPPSRAYRVRKFVRRHRLGVAASAVVAAAVLVAIAGTSIGFLQARREAENARQVSEFLVGMFEELGPESDFGATLSVRDVLDRGAGRLDRELEDQPLVRARLLAAIGHTYRQLGYHDEARPLLERSLEMRRELLGDNHPDVAASLHLLGRLYYWSGDHRRARLTLERALEVYERAYGSEHPQVASTLTTLGFVLWRTGEWALARTQLERALAIEERAPGTDPKRVSNVLYFLGVLALDMRDYGTARSVLQRALTIREQVLGPDHPQVGWALHDLARVDLDTGNVGAARPLLERALAVQERAYGQDNPVVAYPLTKLAHVHSLEGDHATANAFFERALAIREGALGPDHPDLTWTLRPWGAHLLRTGSRVDARRLYDRALAIAENAWGPEHIEVVFCLSEYGLLELDDGNLARARSLFERALAIERKTLEPDNPHAQASLYWLARIESRAGDKERALEHLRETVHAGWARPGSLDDPDLGPLRGDPRFEALVTEVQDRLAAQE